MNRLEEENNHKLQAIQDKLDEYKMNVNDTYASVVPLKKETKNIALKLEQPVQVKAFESKVAEPRGLRLRGIPEMSGIPPDKAFKKDVEKVESVSCRKEVQCQKPEKSWPIQRPQSQTTNFDSTGR